MSTLGLSGTQQATLVLLRTLVGWHFLWEGFIKLWWPSWSRSGLPLAKWTSAGYLQSATGPLAEPLHRLAESAWLPALDLLVAVALLLTGLSLLLGLFTQWGAAAAFVLLASFYVAHIPVRGVIEPGAEGNYLYVDKNLVEAAAVLVLLVFRTGRIAGLDLLLGRRRPARGNEVVEPGPEGGGRPPGGGTFVLDPDDLKPDTGTEAGP
jgi:thiosulfate dehydrogenase [quinone] large subunit